MRTVIFILPKLTEKVNVQQLKAKIHKYVGDRMIEDEPEEMPGLMLKGELSDEDKKEIADFCGTDCGVIFILHEDENDDKLNKDYFEFTV